MTVIRSRDNPRFRELRRLAGSARRRRAAGQLVLDGVHLVEAWRSRFGEPGLIVVAQGAVHRPEVRALMGAAERLELADGLFRELSTVQSPTGLLAVVERPVPAGEPLPDRPAVLLDGIQDPGNLGSILRSTAAAGIDQVLLSATSVDPWAPRVLRAGMGAHFLLRLHEGRDLADFAGRFRGPVLATDVRAPRSLFSTDLRGSVAFVFGSEGGGLSAALRESPRISVCSIPMPGDTESLNVAAAAAVCLFERVRQQMTEV